MMIQRQSNVTYTKWSDLRKAMNTLIQNGTYKRLADIHASRVRDADGFVHARHRMHGGMYGPIGMRRFLPWHRAYLIIFERELRQIDKTLSIPYWDWHADAGNLVGFRGFLGLSTDRHLGTLPDEDPQPDRVRWFVDSRTYDTFTQDTTILLRGTWSLDLTAKVTTGSVEIWRTSKYRQTIPPFGFTTLRLTGSGLSGRRTILVN